VCFSSNFTLYRDISARVMSVLAAEVGQVEQYSIDESFFAFRSPSTSEATKALVTLKHQIERNVGIPVSFGLAKTKTIAKYASVKEKRGSGVCVLTGEDWYTLTSQIPLAKIWGIGQKTTQKMASHSLHTVADLLQADGARVAKLFGIEGVRKRNELSEQVMYALGAQGGDQKSIMNTRSFSKNIIGDKAVLEDALAYHIREAAAEARAKGLFVATLQIMVLPSRYGDWLLYSGVAEQSLEVPTNNTATLLKVATELLGGIYNSQVPYKKAGVVLSGLSTSAGTPTLFTNLATAKPDVSALLDMLNNRFGRETIHIGQRGKTSHWQSNREKLSPHYTTQWSQIAEVKG